jgi:hypothetical protein
MSRQPARLTDLFHHHALQRLALRPSLALPFARHRSVLVQTFHGIVEIAHESAAPEFAVGEDLEAELFLAFQRAQNVEILNLADAVSGGVAIATNSPQLRRAKKTAYVVGAVREGQGD